MLKREELFHSILDILETQRFCALATRGAHYPYCTLVAFVQIENGKKILFATARKTHKYNNLKSHNEISILIDDHKNNPDDINNAMALTILGSANEISEDSLMNLKKLYLVKHPYLEDFINSSDCAMFTVAVKRYLLVQHFQNVMEYKI